MSLLWMFSVHGMVIKVVKVVRVVNTSGASRCCQGRSRLGLFKMVSVVDLRAATRTRHTVTEARSGGPLVQQLQQRQRLQQQQ